MRMNSPWAARIWAQALAPVRHEAAEEALRDAGASPKAAALLIEAGYTSPRAFLEAPWTAREAGGKYESAEWRLSVQKNCTPAALKEALEFRDHLAVTLPRPNRH
jgi:hypothetical protein